MWSPSCGDPHASPNVRPPTLGEIGGWLKTMTTNEYIRGVKQLGWTRFPGRVWQRNDYEHIIRSQEALERSRMHPHVHTGQSPAVAIGPRESTTNWA